METYGGQTAEVILPKKVGFFGKYIRGIPPRFARNIEGFFGIVYIVYLVFFGNFGIDRGCVFFSGIC